MQDFAYNQPILIREDGTKVLVALIKPICFQLAPTTPLCTAVTGWECFYEMLHMTSTSEFGGSGNDAEEYILSSLLSARRQHSMNHRLIEWLGLEGTSRIIRFQPPCHRQGWQPLDQVLDQAAQGPSNLALSLQRWGIHSFPGQPVAVPHYSLSKNFPCYLI